MSKTKKNFKPIKEKVKIPEYKFPSYFNYIPIIFLLATFILSLYIRAYLPYDVVFGGGLVRFASDDAVYQMRLVENTLANFPHRLAYDAFTKFPDGALLHWGPLFTVIIATTSMIVGLGNPNMELVNTIGAFTPSIMGALMVFPVYYISKHLFGNKTMALLSALMIAVLPGQFLGRSVLGFTDHHVAEVLFSTSTIAMYILTLKTAMAHTGGISITSKPIIYSLLSGIILSSYFLTWTGAPFFVVIILIFVVLQSIIDTARNEPITYLTISTIPMLLVSLIFILPFVNFGYGFGWDKYSPFHLLLLIIGSLIPLVLTKVRSNIGNNKILIKYVLSIAILIIISLLFAKLLVPTAYVSLVNAPSFVFTATTGGTQTIGEATSILERPNMLQSSFPILFLSNDKLTILFIMISLIIISIRIFTKKSFELLLLLWSFIMLLAMAGQNRWSYYFAVNFAIISGFIGGSIINWVFERNKNSFFTNDENGIVKIITTVIIITLIFILPSVNITFNTAKYVNNGDPSGGGFSEWYETLTWMKNNTPDTGVDYYGTYEKLDGKYPYPSTAYGVISWWDYGHIITYYAHRIPTSNPFQSGIGSVYTPGVASFFTAKNEESATKSLKEIGNSTYGSGVKYVITNSYMAYEIMGVFGVWMNDIPYFTVMKTSQGDQTVPNRVYYQNTVSLLHIFDGNGLKNYRLVHESKTNPNTQGGYREQLFKQIYNTLYYGNIPVTNSGLVKIFEYVKGAQINGHASPNTEVTLSNQIKTNFDREFDYTQRNISNNDGKYEFTVPYSTTEPLKGETNFDTKPIGKYKITYDNISKEVSVSDEDVLRGNSIHVE